MVAAAYNSLETLVLLLELEANPNLLDNKEQPALYHALLTETPDVILQLLAITNKGLESCFLASKYFSFLRLGVAFISTSLR